MRRDSILALLLVAGCGGGGANHGGPLAGDLAMPRDASPGALATADGTGDLAQSPSCADGMKNGAETDTDCGGGACPPCVLGKRCGSASDCVTNVCAGNACACAANTGDCDQNPANGCEADLTRPETCG